MVVHTALVKGDAASFNPLVTKGPRRKAVALAIVMMSLGATRDAHATHYTLPQLIDRVSQNAPQIDIAREQRAIAESQAHQAWRLALPTGDLTFALTGAPLVRCEDASGYQDPSKTVREQNCARTSVTDLRTHPADALPIRGVGLKLDAKLVQPLYTFGKISAAKEAAEAGVIAATGGIDAARADVVALAVRAYYALKWSRATVATIKDANDKLSTWVTKIDAELDSDVRKSKYTQTDLMRLKLAVEQVELIRLEAERAGEVAIAGLRLLTSDPQADIDDAELELPDDAARPVEYYEEAAALGRPEVRMLSAGIKAAAANRKLQLAQILPDIGIGASFTYAYASSVDDPANAFYNRPNNLSFGLALVVHQPLDFGIRIGKLEQARAEERQANAKRRLALGGIALEIDRAYADVKEARGRAEHTERGERIARSWLNSVDQNLQLGLGEPKDLVEASKGYVEMRLRSLQAILDVHSTLAQLHRTSGAN